MRQPESPHPGALLFGGDRRHDLPEKIARGCHPRVEYLCLQQQFGLEVVGFDNAGEFCPPALRPVQERLLRKRPNLGMALLAPFGPGRWSTVLTTGEDVGLPFAMLQRLLRPNGRGVNIITHGSYFGSKKFGDVARLFRSAPNVRFLCLSEALQRRLIEQHGIPESGALNCGYGVDTRFFTPRPAEAGPAAARRPVLLSAGTAKRDYRSLVAAARGLDVDVRIAADSAWFRTGIDIEGQTLPENVTVASAGDYVGLREAYAEASFVVVPLYESVHACGYAVIVEAMAMGKAVITTRISGHSDYIVEGETGFYVPPKDVDALRDRICYLIDNPDVAHAMGQNARRLIETEHSLEVYVQKLAVAAGLSAK